uniref:Uncharacterized protein n=1 Tax=Lepeophtheirus salmonis TaxID=72036 RepID=A0A0K2UFC3_LEPSM
MIIRRPWHTKIQVFLLLINDDKGFTAQLQM